MKYRAKIDTPWFLKGTIYHYMPYGTYVPDRTIKISPSGLNSFAIDHPENYPDLFEPVEEKTNCEKWEEVFMKIGETEMIESWAKDKADLFDLNGLDATQAYEKIVEGK